MKKTLLLGASLLLLAGCAADNTGGTAKLEGDGTVTATTPDGFALTYEKFTLDNGLEVILHVDDSDPIVAFSTVFHVGSNREVPGRTGFAHFFEHMAFNDSENVPRGWNRLKIPEWGGNRNGGTWGDGTIYYEVVPTDAVDKILWIDSDRMGYMINTVTTEALEREKQVVKNEKRQRYDNAAYGFTSEVIKKALYPSDHPYSWTTIGQLEDLQAATLDDLREFYDRYYGASNATLAIAGDFDPAEMKEKVRYWFGEIRAGEPVSAMAPRPVTLEADKSLYWEDNFATLPELRITRPSVEEMNGDEIALDVLSQLLAGTKSSPLYQVVVEERKLAPGIAAYNSSQEIAGEFTIRVRASSGQDLDAVRAAIQEGLERFEEEGIDPDALRRIKNEQETGLYAGISTVLGKANALAAANEFNGDPAYELQKAAKLQAVTAEDIMRVYERYVKDQPAVYTSFVPKGQTELALAGAEEAEVTVEVVRNDVAAEEVSAGALAEYERTPTIADRSEPDFGELPLFTMPDIYEARVGGARLLGIESSETPLVTYDISIDHGSFRDPDDAQGRAVLLASLLNEGTASKTAGEFGNAAGLLGATIDVEASGSYTTVTVTTLERNLEETALLVEELLRTPRFTEESFDKVQRALLTGIAGQRGNPGAMANYAFQNLLYGAEHPAGQPSFGTAESVSALTLDDMRAAHEALLGGNVTLHVVGDARSRRARKALAPIPALFSGEAEELVMPAPMPPATDGRVFFIDVPGSKQSVIFAGKTVPPTTDPAFDLIDFTNEKLGGGINGDLSQTLRIEKGYTYGAYSSLSRGTYPQTFRIATNVRANATGPSLEIIDQMVREYGPTFTEEDTEITKQKIVKDNTRTYESLGAKLSMLRNISRYGESKRYLEEEQERLLAMSTEDFQRIASEYLEADEMVYVVVGDGATQSEAVSAFGGGTSTTLQPFTPYGGGSDR
ncbi:M16 family metallopeptidase [Parvularcula maris]|uniref:Insulinase family protein n=1 Tax=Parvularcula maris TaxID=2965077 RepID=A0A9X2RIX1_9PROT|nr:pitrilysin family protein [Parvularcula maris]MCQ8184053.1 insulinase family protein [Parvularcula maris]